LSSDSSTRDDRIDELLAACLEEPTARQDERIEAICAREPVLATELRRRYSRLVELGMIDASSAPRERAPEQLGHYRLLRRIGGGGMGVVYEARDEKLNRRVALKIIRRDQSFFAGSRERFAREMQAASRFDHANLCPIYEAGEIDGVPYIAMRYVEGHSLAALLEARRSERASASTSSRSSSGRRRLEATLLLIEKLARALHAAHEAGLVHRDVKPANV
jgi:serine/threonine protein kinase